MLFPSPLFHMREFGAALEGGWMCPQCKGDRLRVTKAGTHPEPDELTCPSCGGQYRSGWRRHVWRSEVPQAVRGTPADNLGGFFETLQHYPARPELPAPGEERNVHLADFVIDLDRETLPAAQVDVLTLHAYLDALAPGQVRLYYSGSKGFHVVVPWQTLGAVPSPDLVQRDYRFLAARIHRETGVMPDYKLYSPDRMLRLPDTWHGKTGRYKVEVLPEEVWECEFLSMSPRGVLNTAPAAVAPGLAALYATAREEAEETRERLGDLTPRLDFKGSSLRGADPHSVQYLKA